MTGEHIAAPGIHLRRNIRQDHRGPNPVGIIEVDTDHHAVIGAFGGLGKFVPPGRRPAHRIIQQLSDRDHATAAPGIHPLQFGSAADPVKGHLGDIPAPEQPDLAVHRDRRRRLLQIQRRVDGVRHAGQEGVRCSAGADLNRHLLGTVTPGQNIETRLRGGDFHGETVRPGVVLPRGEGILSELGDLY